MVSTKTHRAIDWLLFLFLVIFPLGQLLKINLNFLDFPIRIHLIDLIAGGFLFIYLFGKFEKPVIYKQLAGLVSVMVFSWILAITMFGLADSITGFMYLLRFISYSAVFLVLTNYFKDNTKAKVHILKSLIIVGVAVSIIGWVQYFLLPYFGAFTVWGWDDHLYRLIGTFLDPGYTGIILVFSLLIALLMYIRDGKRMYLAIVLLFLISTLFTYSRGTYVGLITSLTLLTLFIGKFRYFLIIFLSIFLLVLMLPRPGGAGTELERTFSIETRIRNYSETVTIFKSSPVFGIGFNNMCIARNKLLNDTDTLSHSCSGSDSSLLLVLATTGVVGLTIFFEFLIKLISGTKKNYYGLIFLVSLTALFTHSIFSNSMFYPWVLGWMAILAAMSQSKFTRSS